MRTLLRATAVATILLILAPAASLAETGAQQADGAAAGTTAELANQFYNTGLRMNEKAAKFEEQAAEETDPAKQAKLEEKATKQYEKAIRYFELALEKNPGMHPALSDQGYATRKLGDLAAALELYDKALEIEPGYTPAIEYRAEAFLGLDLVEDAKQAYMLLFNEDRQQADNLMGAMKTWLQERQQDPGEVDSETIEEFAGWVQEREELAGQVSNISQKRDWK